MADTANYTTWQRRPRRCSDIGQNVSSNGLDDVNFLRPLSLHLWKQKWHLSRVNDLRDCNFWPQYSNLLIGSGLSKSSLGIKLYLSCYQRLWWPRGQRWPRPRLETQRQGEQQGAQPRAVTTRFTRSECKVPNECQCGQAPDADRSTGLELEKGAVLDMRAGEVTYPQCWPRVRITWGTL